jgi:site-specific DNA recombinase
VRVATYTRISTDEENQPYSLSAQDDRLVAYVRSQEGWEIVRKYTDQMTGSTLERPDLQRALADARCGLYDLLLVCRVDRLSRSVRGLTQFLEDLAAAGVLFRSATEPVDTGSPSGRMSLQMLGVFAEFERATLIDRVVAGMERKASRGEWHGGRTPYGYAGNSSGLTIVQSEAEVVRTIFDLCHKKRLGSRAIANWLKSRGIARARIDRGATRPSWTCSETRSTRAKSRFAAACIRDFIPQSSTRRPSKAAVRCSMSAVRTGAAAGATPPSTSWPGC